MKKVINVLMGAVVMLAVLAGCRSNNPQETKPQKYNGMMFDVFDTVITVATYQDSQEDFDKIQQYIEDRYTELNKLYDIYNNYSGINNIKTINDNAGKEPVEVCQEIIDLLLFSKEWYTISGGKMNVAMGAVLREWHNFREGYEHDHSWPLPKLETLQEKAKHVDIDCVEIDTENMTVFITDPDVRLDVGAVAKGFATEIVCDELSEFCDNFALSAGGNVKTHGQPKDERERWGIGLQNPAVDEDYNMIGGNMDTAYFNTDMSLVCSGGYQRYAVVDGRRYHHLIDPVTLFPEEIYQGVAIFCEDSGMADALSTTVFLSQPEDALELVEGMDGVECVLVLIDGTVLQTQGANQYLASAGVTSNTK